MRNKIIILLVFLGLSIGLQANAFEMFIGSYVGNGNDNRSITGIGFQPDLVEIQAKVWTSSDMSTNESKQFGNDESLNANTIQVLESDGFQLGTDSDVNSDGKTYFFNAYRDNGDGDFAVGTYTGNGVDNRDIDGVGFQPAFIVIGGDLNDYSFGKSTDIPASSAFGYAGFTLQSNHIQSIRADGFQVGDDNATNQDTTTYFWFAFKATDDEFETGSYTGNSTDNRNITSGFTFVPESMHIGNSNPTSSIFRNSAMKIDVTIRFGSTATTSNEIQEFITTGIQVGTSARSNETGTTYYWMSWALPVSSTENRSQIIF